MNTEASAGSKGGILDATPEGPSDGIPNPARYRDVLGDRVFRRRVQPILELQYDSPLSNRCSVCFNTLQKTALELAAAALI